MAYNKSLGMGDISKRHFIKQKVEKCAALQILQDKKYLLLSENLSFWFNFILSLFFFAIRNLLYGL